MADVEKIFVCNIENSNIKSINDIPKDKRGFAGYLSIKGETLKFEYDELTNSTSIYCTSMSKERFMNSEQSYYALKDLGAKPESIKKGRDFNSFVDKMLEKMRDEIERKKIEASKIGYRIKEVPSYVNDISQLDYEDYDALSYLRNKGFQFDFSVEGGTKYLYCVNKSKNDYNYERVNYWLNIRPIFVESNKEYSVENAAHFIVSEGKRCTSEQLEKMKRMSKEGKEQFAKLGYDETFEMLDEIDDTLESLQLKELRELRDEVAIQSYSIKESEDKFAFLGFISARIEHFILEKNKRLEGIMKLILGVIKEEADYSVGNQSDTVIEVNSDILFAIDSLNKTDREELKTKLEQYLETCDATEFLPINSILNKMQEQEKEKEKKDLTQSYRSL